MTARAEGGAFNFEGEAIEEKGKMRVFVNGEQIYSKGPFNAVAPQPTPDEVQQLITDITTSAGAPAPLSEEEAEEFAALHAAQIAAGKSKH